MLFGMLFGKYGRFDMVACQHDDSNKNIRFNPLLTKKEQLYCIGSFAISIVDFLIWQQRFKQGTMRDKLLGSSFFLASLMSLGAFMEKKKWAKYTEMSKYLLYLFSMTTIGQKEYRENHFVSFVESFISKFNWK